MAVVGKYDAGVVVFAVSLWRVQVDSEIRTVNYIPDEFVPFLVFVAHPEASRSTAFCSRGAVSGADFDVNRSVLLRFDDAPWVIDDMVGRAGVDEDEILELAGVVLFLLDLQGSDLCYVCICNFRDIVTRLADLILGVACITRAVAATIPTIFGTELT